DSRGPQRDQDAARGRRHRARREERPDHGISGAGQAAPGADQRARGTATLAARRAAPRGRPPRRGVPLDHRGSGGMSGVIAVFKRELASYFATPIAYVFIVIFLVVSNAFTFFYGGFY